LIKILYAAPCDQLFSSFIAELPVPINACTHSPEALDLIDVTKLALNQVAQKGT